MEKQNCDNEDNESIESSVDYGSNFGTLLEDASERNNFEIVETIMLGDGFVNNLRGLIIYLIFFH
jgi:hypothetical protein